MKRENGKKELQSQVHLSWWVWEMLYVAWTNFTGPSACGFNKVTRTITRLVKLALTRSRLSLQISPKGNCRIGFGWMVNRLEPGQRRVKEGEWRKSREESKRVVSSFYCFVSWASDQIIQTAL